MEGKVNCTCGWSWNKSDSSKKDMYICHECGRDNSNNMKNGGWLDSYADGGSMQEHQENYNDYKVSAPEGMVGDGFSNVGRNYSPAWGGQFQTGGYLKKVKKTEKDLLKKYVNPAQARALTRAKQQGINTGIHNGPLDAIRHSSSAAAMSSALPTWTNFIPGVAPLKIAATNIAGAAHELNAPNDWKEHASDLYNNFIGSVVGVLPVSEKNKHDLLIQAQKHGVLSDMGDKTPLRKRPAAPQLPQLKLPPLQMGGSVYPVNYVPEAQDGISEDAMRGMMKSKIGMGNAFEHPAIKRMSQAMPKTGMTPEGIGTHYMSSVDNYAVPLLQDLGEEELTLVDPDSRSKEAIRFNSPEEAQYFAEHYKDLAPMSTTFKGLQEYAMGGSIPGAVGFSYARTQSPAPSNGKYAKKTMANAQNGKEMKYYQEGLDWKPKTISKNGGWLDSYDVAQTGQQQFYQGDIPATDRPIQKDGGVIKDDMGQWAHPGEITRISGGKITMKKDPKTGKALTEPLLGIADTGEQQWMYPGEDYNFEGANYVTEIPKRKLAKNGLRQEQKGLQNLDNLLNFTNYNKPQPGGWLSKYE